MRSRPDVIIRPETPNDADAIDRVVGPAFLAEFGTTSEVELVRALRARGELVAALTLVALANDEVVGHLAMSEVTLDGHRVGGLGLAPLAVRPDRQGMGIGSALMQAGLERAESDGHAFVVLLGHEDYYPRFGFEPAASLGITGDYGDHAGWMVRLLAAPTLPRGHVRYCSAFHS